MTPAQGRAEARWSALAGPGAIAPDMRRILRRVFPKPAARSTPSRPPPAAPPKPMAPLAPAEAARFARAYHDRTRHFPARYARALGFMDWDSQPDPFRRWEGAPRVLLPIPTGPGAAYEAAFVEGLLPAAPVDLAGIGALFYDSLALSAWKEAGDARWALRVNPSSGNLHPTEGWLVAGPIAGLCDEPAVYHYDPREHALERRAVLAEGPPPGVVLVALSSVPWREAWKYGERAFRYCQHDAGHALAGVAIAAAGLGWRTRLLEGPTDDQVAALLGLRDREGEEAEHPELILAVGPDAAEVALPAPPDAHVGVANRLSEAHHDWPIIADVELATRKQAGAGRWEEWQRPPRAFAVGDSDLGLRGIVRQRRSAVSMDGKSGLTLAAFQQVLAKVLPGQAQVPFSAMSGPPLVDLLLWVHRVADLTPGLYALVRDGDRLERLRAALDPAFSWEQRSPLPLYLLREGDVRNLAAGTSCGQDIAADGVFAAAMLADLGAIDRHGADLYRRLHWEAGAIGQQLYLEAEASGVRATGIGCFFDEESGRCFGLRDQDLRVIYHFTVGGPVDDERLRTVDAYAERGA